MPGFVDAACARVGNNENFRKHLRVFIFFLVCCSSHSIRAQHNNNNLNRFHKHRQHIHVRTTAIWLDFSPRRCVVHTKKVTLESEFIYNFVDSPRLHIVSVRPHGNITFWCYILLLFSFLVPQESCRTIRTPIITIYRLKMMLLPIHNSPKICAWLGVWIGKIVCDSMLPGMITHTPLGHELCAILTMKKMVYEKEFPL